MMMVLHTGHKLEKPRIEVSEQWFTVSFSRPIGRDEHKDTVESGRPGTTFVLSLSHVCPKSVPDKLRSSKQRYRLTELGQELLKRQGKEQS